MKVVFCTPSLTGPTAPYLAALEASIPLFHKAGWEEEYVQEVGCPYISHARATMTRKALSAGADVIIYLDYDLSWAPIDLLRLALTEGDVVAGTYRYKKDEEVYMGTWKQCLDGTPRLTPDGNNISGFQVPAGFLKVTRNGIRRMMKAYPELVYGDLENPSFDLFNHGAHEGVWYGEDMAFCRRWTDIGGDIVLIPDLQLDHHKKVVDEATGEVSYKVYPGNLHNYLINQPKPVLGDIK